VSAPPPSERLRQARRLLAAEGARGIAARILRRALEAAEPPGYARVPVARADLDRASELAAAGAPLAAGLGRGCGCSADRARV